MIYSIDTSALIDLDRWYSYEVFAPLWDNNFVALVNEGRLIASVEVRDELRKGDDFLYRWVMKSGGPLCDRPGHRSSGAFCTPGE